MRKTSEKFKKYNHHHQLTKEQRLVDFGTGEFIADKKRIPLLKALNECGLITRTHCYGHETGYSFISILFENNMHVEIVEIKKMFEKDAKRTKFNGKTELLINWKRID